MLNQVSDTDYLESEIKERRHRRQRRLDRARVWFDREVREAHRRLRQSIPAYLRQGNVFSLLTAPVIYSLLVPLVIVDVWVTLYQSVCFPIYGIPRVPRRRYFAIDHRSLLFDRVARCAYNSVGDIDLEKCHATLIAPLRRKR